MTSTKIRRISLGRLVPHPDHPNRMSRATFAKLVRNIERTGRYEPLVVRPCPGRRGFFQIVNGHHRCAALRILGHKTAEAVVWNVNDEQTDLLMATLNRLGGRDMLDKKLALLQRLSVALALRTLAQLLPQTHGQLERLIRGKGPVETVARKGRVFATPIVFFADETQERLVAQALVQAAVGLPEGLTRAAGGPRPWSASRGGSWTGASLQQPSTRQCGNQSSHRFRRVFPRLVYAPADPLPAAGTRRRAL